MKINDFLIEYEEFLVADAVAFLYKALCSGYCNHIDMAISAYELLPVKLYFQDNYKIAIIEAKIPNEEKYIFKFERESMDVDPPRCREITN